MKKTLMNSFAMTDMDKVNHTLGMALNRNCGKGTLTTTQWEYIRQMLERVFGMLDTFSEEHEEG